MALSLGMFDADYYREAVSGRPDEQLARRRPLKHYLSVGGFDGLNPGPGFDSAWYLANYRDVQTSGLNPLVHYALYGRAEGRRPYLGAKPPYLAESPYTQPARCMGEQLWAGFAWRVRPELEALAQSGDGEAAWQLALWAYAFGEREEARDWLAVAKAPGGEPQRALALAKCGVRLGAALKAELSPQDRALVELNEADLDDQALMSLNECYQAVNLAPLAPEDTGRPLSLDNLRGESNVPANHSAWSGGQRVMVSVVMCAHNAQDTLPTALESVLAQSWQNLDVIVVDDASTDQTAQVVQRYETADARVRLLRNERNLGAYGARNRGARAARGQYITVHDSDDWSHPQKLERQLTPLLSHPSRVASVSHWVRVRAPFTVVGAWQLDQGFMERNPSSWLVRREVFENIGYWDEVKVEADTEFALRLEHHYGRAALVAVLPDTPLALARVGTETLTQQSASHVRTQFYGLRRLYAESARSWHRASRGKPVLHEGERPFSVPLGSIIGARPGVNRVVVSNCAVEGASLEELLRRLDDGFRHDSALALMHWPERTAWVGNEVADEVFQWAQRHGVHWVHPGLTLEALQVQFLQSLPWRERPSPVAALPDVEVVLDSDGALCDPQDAWLGYFRAGGERF